MDNPYTPRKGARITLTADDLAVNPLVAASRMKGYYATPILPLARDKVREPTEDEQSKGITPEPVTASGDWTIACTASDPTPPAAAWTTTLSPGCTRALVR